jgi:hypothetical protein
MLRAERSLEIMKPMEFQTTLKGGQTLQIPAEIAAKLPDHGTATVVLMVDGEPDEREWLNAAQQHFLRDDSEADASYDRYL